MYCNVALMDVRVTIVCRGRAMSVKYCEFGYVALVTRHANRIFSASYYIVICGLSSCIIFSPSLSHRLQDYRIKFYVYWTVHHLDS